MPEADEISAAAGLPVLTPGLMLAGRYRLEEIAGQGGMSVVWKATDTVLEHATALKFLPTLLATDRNALADLRAEARRVRDLAHPQICRVYDYGEDSTRRLAWISMEFLPGGNLSRQLKEHPRGFFEPAEIVGWVRELCDALTYAHEVAHVIHRDLKPANLLIDARGHLRITDFGIARSISESFTRLTGSRPAAATTGTGTAYYMSPQQAIGERPRSTDDIYSLGATVFELLTGEPPFASGDLAWQREHAPPSRIADRRRQLHNVEASVPEGWERLLQRLLAKHPSHRPQSVREVSVELMKVDAPAPVVPLASPAQPATSKAAPEPPALPTPATTAKPTSAPAATSPVMRQKIGIDPWIWALGGLIAILIILTAILLLMVGK